MTGKQKKYDREYKMQAVKLSKEIGKVCRSIRSAQLAASSTRCAASQIRQKSRSVCSSMQHFD